MKELEGEQILWQSKNKRLLLTTHRLREMHKSFFDSTIKSIMLEELTSCELRTIRQFRFLRQALFYFLAINGAVFLLNNYLFKAELIKALFGQVHIGPQTALLLFFLSLALAAIYIALFFSAVKKVFSFYSTGMTINIQLRWLDFEERESFISQIEETKDQRHRCLYSGKQSQDQRKSD